MKEIGFGWLHLYLLLFCWGCTMKFYILRLVEFAGTLSVPKELKELIFDSLVHSLRKHQYWWSWWKTYYVAFSIARSECLFFYYRINLAACSFWLMLEDMVSVGHQRAVFSYLRLCNHQNSIIALYFWRDLRLLEGIQELQQWIHWFVVQSLISLLNSLAFHSYRQSTSFFTAAMNFPFLFVVYEIASFMIMVHNSEISCWHCID